MHPSMPGDGVIDIGELRASLITLGHPNPSDAELQVPLCMQGRGQEAGCRQWWWQRRHAT